jgi:AbiV family abortive infection protein
MAKNEGPISKPLVEEFGLAAAANALSLCEEARLLHDAGYRARAYALAVLAAEELAKAHAASIAQTWGGDPAFWPAFWKLVQGKHPEKLETVHFLERMTPALLEREPDEMSRALSAALSSDGYERKNRAMYVDLEDGAVRGPEEIAADEEAQELGSLYIKSVTTFAVIIEGMLEDGADDGEEYPTLPPPQGI